MNSEPVEISILGSTGSIGTQTLDVISDHPELFRASVLTAGRNWELLSQQARKWRPRLAVIADERFYEPLRDSLRDTGVEVAAGTKAVEDAAALLDNDIVVGALVGYSGLRPTLRALEKGKTVALANKETLVAGGAIVTETCRRNNGALIPVDSEHSAIFQCLQGEDPDKVSKIILTASGGPFRNTPAEKLRDVTPADALKHPNWSMGAKVTIDSASMMNKGFEMIEARWLFDTAPDNIEIVVHPQSVIHSMVEYIDGSVKAQLGIPDMRLPIRYALGYPERLPSKLPRLSLTEIGTLTFEAPDYERFPMLRLAFEAIKAGGGATTVLNAANEVAVDAFLNHGLHFTDMPVVVENTLEKMGDTSVSSPDDIANIHNLATERARELARDLQR